MLHFYPAPYGHFNKNKWEPILSLTETNDFLVDGLYTNNQFIEIVNNVYGKQDLNIPSHIVNNVTEYKNLIISNWLILPADQLDRDDGSTKEWKCRDMDFQYTVYVDYDLFDADQYFSNKSYFRQFQIRHGIQCYAYEFHQALNKGYLEKATIYIGDEQKQSIWIVKNQCYDSKTGLHFNDIED